MAECATLFRPTLAKLTLQVVVPFLLRFLEKKLNMSREGNMTLPIAIVIISFHQADVGLADAFTAG